MDRKRTLYGCVITVMLLCLLLPYRALAAETGARLNKPVITKAAVQPKISPPDLSALAEMSGQIYGAGKGVLAFLDEAGNTSQTKPMPVSQVAGLAPFTQGRLLVGDGASNTLFALDPNSGQTTRLFALSEVRPWNNPRGSVLKNCELASLAFDGSNVYVGVRAGYSSSIVKINPNTREIQSHAWSPGPNPSAMSFANNRLFVVDGDNQMLRSYTGVLQLNMAATALPPGGKGLLIRNGAVMMVNPAQKNLIRQNVDLSKLLATPIIANPGVSVARPGLRIDPDKIKLSRRIAVLICGDVAESGYNEFWNDTIWLYKTLRTAGYTADCIYVLYGDGTDFASANPIYRYTETVTDFAATVANVNMVFDGLKNGDSARGIVKMTADDTLFVWTFDHGAGGSPAYLCLRDGDISDTSFAAKLNAVPCASRAIYMQQCRSGGFIDNLRSTKTFISTACRADQNAQRANTENEVYGGMWYYHGEYNFHIICALSGRTPTGSPVNADSNSNGMVSALECHNWETSHEDRAEVPQMDDMGGVGSTLNLN